MSEDTDRGPLREVRRTLYGFGFSLFVIGVFALLFFYVIPTYFRSSGRDWKQEKSRTITLNYLRTDDSGGKDYGPLLEELTDSRVGVVDKLELDPGEVPDRIHVYLHRDLNSLKTAISTRRNSPEVDVPLATMDVIEGKPIKPILVRLLTTFTWGRPSSEFLRLGLQTYFSNQYEEIHLRAAALEGTGFSFDEVTALEETTSHLRSLQDRIYDSFDSPRASAGLDLGSLSSLFRFEAAERPYKYELEVQSGSFVSYLIREYGVEKLRQLWEASSLEEGFQEVFGVTVSDMEESWRTYVTMRAKGKENHNYFRARSFFNQGALDEARDKLEGLERDGVPEKDIAFLKGQVNFFAGNWEEAKENLSSPAITGLSESKERMVRRFGSLIGSYRAGKSWNSGRLYLVSSESLEGSDVLAREVLHLWKRVREELPSLDWNYSRFMIFLAGEEVNEDWEEVASPDWVAIYGGDGDPGVRAVELFVRGAKRIPTYSGLLRQGLIHYLAGEDVFAEATSVLEDGRWSPLDGLTFDGTGKMDSKREAAAFVGYIIEEFGSEDFLDIWNLTTPLGGDKSLESALRDTVGIGLGKAEENLKNYLSKKSWKEL
ncbi:hypothetical protein KGY71_00010 [Candidatus Bipolaricaulota bacterium]|nr:hypothetical protein [Candidatus Bipolaricaulota bacterium]